MRVKYTQITQIDYRGAETKVQSTLFIPVRLTVATANQLRGLCIWAIPEKKGHSKGMCFQISTNILVSTWSFLC